jgi:UDP-glucose 4-epimerase
MYAASKVYCEGLISAYCLAYGMRSWIYRFVSVLGERYTHGVVFSFSKQLLEQERSHQPLELAFLSDGTPTKSYMYVGDCVSGIWHGVQHAKDQVNIFNLGTDEEISAREIGEIIIDELGMHGKVRMTFGTTQRGWVGDAPHIRPSIARLQSLGWRPQLSIRDAIRRTVRYLKDNPWTLGEQYFRGAAMDERTFRT